MNDKKLSRMRRAAKTRATIARLKAVRMTVHRTDLPDSPVGWARAVGAEQLTSMHRSAR